MKRARQHCMTCTPVEWEAIRERARTAGMSMSRFIVSCGLENPSETPAVLALSEEEQFALRDRINLLLLATQDLLHEPLPGTEVTMREAVAFLYLAERDRPVEQWSLPGLGDAP